MSSYFSTFLHRVGQAVETVGQAGRPKTITGFQVSAFTVSCLVSSVILRCRIYHGVSVGGCATLHCALPRFVTLEASKSDAFLSSISLIMCTIQTHTTPVLLGHRDRAELAGQEYSTLVSVMEGVVIVEKIPEQAVQT